MHNEKFINPTSIDDCCVPTSSVERLTKVSKVLGTIRTVIVTLEIISILIVGLVLLGEIEEGWIFFLTILVGAVIVGITYLSFFLTILAIDSFASLVHSSNTSTKLKIYELRKNENNSSKDKEEKVIIRSVNSTWICPICNGENLQSEVYCRHCGTPSGYKEIKSNVQPSQAPVKTAAVTKPSSSYNTWVCKCGTVNSRYDMFCAKCRARIDKS